MTHDQSKEARQMAQDNATRDDAPFKRPVYAVESCITDEAGKLIFVLCHPRGMKAQLNDDELEAAAELTATAINAYSPEREADIARKDEIIGTLYQVIGVLADQCGLHSHPKVIGAMDLAAYGELEDGVDPLPFDVVANPEREKAVRGLVEASKALLKLNDEWGPFGGEIARDRAERVWDNFRAAIAAYEASK